MLLSLGLASLIALAYWPVRHHQFIRFDDDLYVTKNYHVQQGLTGDGIKWAFTTTEGGNWHPLTWLSHMLDVQWFGRDAGAHHLVSILFHLANTLLLFFVLRKMTGAFWRSAVVAALFALHPLHVESVAWIAERKDVLSTFFGLLTLWFYARFARNKMALHPRPSALDYFLALVSFALALMSKPMLVTLPCVLLLLDFWPMGRVKWSELRPARSVLLEKLPFFALTVVSSILTFFAQRNTGAMASLEQMAFPQRLGNALVAYVAYLGKMIWPQGLTVLYPIEVWPLWKILTAMFVLLTVTAMALKWSARRPYLLFGWLWYLGMLVPVIGLVHVGSQSMADRYTYLPLVGIFVALTWGAFELLRVRLWRVVVATAAILLCTIATRSQVGQWRNSETLFRHTLRSTRNNVVIQNNLAAELIERGQLDEAISLLQEALTINSHLANTMSNLGSALERRGQTDEALRLYERSVRLQPKNPEAQNNLGFLLLMRGRSDEALPHFLLSLESRPEFSEPHYNLGNIYFLRGDLASALVHYRLAVKYQPDYAEARSNLGYTLSKLGQPEVALPHLETAVRLKPTYAQAHNNLAEVLLRLGKSNQAEGHARQAVQLNPTSGTFQNILGRTLAGQRKWDDAQAAFYRATELQPRFAEAHFNLANTFSALGRIPEAKTHYRAALELQSSYPEAEMQLAMLLLREGKMEEVLPHLRKIVAERPDWKEPLNNLAWLLATRSGDPKKEGAESVQLARRSLALSSEGDFSTLDTLAAACAQAGQFQEAIAVAEKAMALAHQAGDTNSAAQIGQRRELYQQGKPFRE